LIAKRNAEIKFLKDTVRLECEERIQLVAKLAVLSQGANDQISKAPIKSSSQLEKSSKVHRSATLPSLASNTKPPSSPNLELKRVIHSKTPQPNPSSRQSSAPDEIKRSFELRMQEAAAKKEKKLAKSSSRMKLSGI
jgi:hypothetical protein